MLLKEDESARPVTEAAHMYLPHARGGLLKAEDVQLSLRCARPVQTSTCARKSRIATCWAFFRGTAPNGDSRLAAAAIRRSSRLAQAHSNELPLKQGYT